MTSIPFSTWILPAFDPVLILVVGVLAWKADQYGKVFLAVIAAVAASVLFGWVMGLTGLPWHAPVGRDVPTLLPVRTVSAFVWGSLIYGAKRVVRGRETAGR